MSRAPAHCEIRIEGHLDQHWSAWFGDMALSREADGTTVLRGEVADQSAVHGLLAKVRDLGAALLSVTVSATSDQVAAPPSGGPPAASDRSSPSRMRSSPNRNSSAKS